MLIERKKRIFDIKILKFLLYVFRVLFSNFGVEFGSLIFICLCGCKNIVLGEFNL